MNFNFCCEKKLFLVKIEIFDKRLQIINWKITFINNSIFHCIKKTQFIFCILFRNKIKYFSFPIHSKICILNINCKFVIILFPVFIFIFRILVYQCSKKHFNLFSGIGLSKIFHFQFCKIIKFKWV